MVISTGLSVPVFNILKYILTEFVLLLLVASASTKATSLVLDRRIKQGQVVQPRECLSSILALPGLTAGRLSFFILICLSLLLQGAILALEFASDAEDIQLTRRTDVVSFSGKDSLRAVLGISNSSKAESLGEYLDDIEYVVGGCPGSSNRTFFTNIEQILLKPDGIKKLPEERVICFDGVSVDDRQTEVVKTIGATHTASSRVYMRTETHEVELIGKTQVTGYFGDRAFLIRGKMKLAILPPQNASARNLDVTCLVNGESRIFLSPHDNMYTSTICVSYGGNTTLVGMFQNTLNGNALTFQRIRQPNGTETIVKRTIRDYFSIKDLEGFEAYSNEFVEYSVRVSKERAAIVAAYLIRYVGVLASPQDTYTGLGRKSNFDRAMAMSYTACKEPQPKVLDVKTRTTQTVATITYFGVIIFGLLIFIAFVTILITEIVYYFTRTKKLVPSSWDALSKLYDDDMNRRGGSEKPEFRAAFSVMQSSFQNVLHFGIHNNTQPQDYADDDNMVWI